MEPDLLGLHWVWVILAAFGFLLGIGLGVLLMAPVRPEQVESAAGPAGRTLVQDHSAPDLSRKESAPQRTKQAA